MTPQTISVLTALSALAFMAPAKGNECMVNLVDENGEIIESFFGDTDTMDNCQLAMMECQQSLLQYIGELVSCIINENDDYPDTNSRHHPPVPYPYPGPGPYPYPGPGPYPYPGPQPGYLDTIRCESLDFRYNICRARADIRSAWVKHQISSTRCTYGYNWGFQNRTLWVGNGCRALFTVQYW